MEVTGAKPAVAAVHLSLMAGLCFLLTWKGGAVTVAWLSLRDILKERAGDLDLDYQV